MALPGFPSGFRFLPNDQELIYLLFMKLTGRSFSPVDVMLIPESNLFGKQEPWELFDEFGPKYIPFYGSDDLFFFSKLNKKTPNSKNVERRIGITGGTWHGEDKGKQVVAEVEIDRQWVQIEGVKKRFKYKNKSSEHNHRWIMSEISVPALKGENNYVLCRMRKNVDVVPANPNKRRAACKGKDDAEPPIKRRKVKGKNAESENNYSAQINPGFESNFNNGDDSAISNVESELNHDNDDRALPEPIVPEQGVLSSDLEVECGGEDDVQRELIPDNFEDYLENLLESNTENDLISENQSFNQEKDDQEVPPEPFIRSNDPTVPPEQGILISDLEVECGGDDDVQIELIPDNIEDYLDNLLQSNTENNLNSENQSLNQDGDDDLSVHPEPVTSSQFLHIAEDNNDDHLTVLEQPVSDCDFKFEFGEDDDEGGLLPDNFERYLESDDISFDLIVEPEMNQGDDSRMSIGNYDLDAFVQSFLV